MFQRSNKAMERAIELDPNRITAARQLIANRAERGELGNAFQAAQALVKLRPESAEPHFARPMSIAMPGCWDSRQMNATRRWRSTPVTMFFVRAPGRSWS